MYVQNIFQGVIFDIPHFKIVFSQIFLIQFHSFYFIQNYSIMLQWKKPIAVLLLGTIYLPQIAKNSVKIEFFKAQESEKLKLNVYEWRFIRF